MPPQERVCTVKTSIGWSYPSTGPVPIRTATPDQGVYVYTVASVSIQLVYSLFPLLTTQLSKMALRPFARRLYLPYRSGVQKLTLSKHKLGCVASTYLATTRITTEPLTIRVYAP